MSTFLKKNWFVVLIVLIFTGFSIFYIYDTNKGKLKGKKANGEDVVYSISDQDITASQFYDDLYKSSGANSAITLFEAAVANSAIETTNEIKDNAEAQAASIISSYQSQYGSAYEDFLKSALAETGYTDLVDYLIVSQKLTKLTAEYAKENFDDLKIRDISYILIKYEDTTAEHTEPTEDEKKRMKAVDDALASGKSFEEVAKEFSEDEASKDSGGVLGVIDKNSSLDSAFLEAALALEEGESTKEWIKSTDKTFGYFLVKNNASTQATLEAKYVDTDPYESLIQQYDGTIASNAIWEKANKLGVDFNGNEDLETFIKDYYAVEEGSDE